MGLFLLLGFQSKHNCAALPAWSKVTCLPAIFTPVLPKPIFSRTFVMVQAQTVLSCAVKDFGSETLLDSGQVSTLLLEWVGWILTNFLIFLRCSDSTE